MDSELCLVFFSLLVLKTMTTLIQPLFEESLLSTGIFSLIFRSLISSSPFLLTHAILQTTEVIALQLACFVVLMQNLMRCDTLPSLSRRVNASHENKPFKNLEIRHCKYWSFPATFCYKTEPAVFLVSGAWETCSWRQQRLPHKAKIWLDE